METEIQAEELPITQPASDYLIWLGGLAMSDELLITQRQAGLATGRHPVSSKLGGGYRDQPSCCREGLRWQ